MIAPDSKNAPSAEEVKIAVAAAIEQILALASTKADVEAERLQHAHHHLVQMLRVQTITLRFPLGQHGADVEAPAAPVGFHLVNLGVSHVRRLVRATMREVFSGISARSHLFGQPAGKLVAIRIKVIQIEAGKGKLGAVACSNIPAESKIAAMLKRY